ncbi:AEC family transporter [Algirhabdus cladophorae]|uniref:AEC family transporter n=1 Tax=Algirhabdus cladophorae TaxID=3377108 RepID=UPI003B8471B0
MQALLDVILPVFLVIGFGYAAAKRDLISDEAIDGLVRFTQNFAIPCLLFRSISQLDLGVYFHPSLLFSYYGPATVCFVLGIVGARAIFKRPMQDSVAIGFCCLFANSVLLGLPITERAYGESELDANFALIAINAPFCYGLGIITMEIVRNQGGGFLATSRAIVDTVFHNALIIAIGLGFLVNLTGLPLPGVLTDALDMMILAALPAAIFSLGGVLTRYKLEGDLMVALMICGIVLILRPILTYGMASQFTLTENALRSATLTAAMAPGINAYVFANMYGVAKRVAASSILIATGLSLITVWIWLIVLP